MSSPTKRAHVGPILTWSLHPLRSDGAAANIIADQRRSAPTAPANRNSLLTGREAYNASFPDVHGAHTCGWTVEETTDRLQDCLETALGGYLHDSEDLPEPSSAEPGQVLVAVSPAVAARLALYTAMRSQAVTADSLAQRLGVRSTRIRRLMDPRRPAKLSALEPALAALGLSLVAEAQPQKPTTPRDIATQT